MSRKIAVNIEGIARTERRFENIACDVRSAVKGIEGPDLPGAQLAVSFSSELAQLLAKAVIAVDDVESWANTASENVRETGQDLLQVDSDSAAVLAAIMRQIDPGHSALRFQAGRR